MYLAIDIGGTKTLIGVFTKNGDMKNHLKFPTPQDYGEFLDELGVRIKELGEDDFLAVCVAAPAKINHERGTIIAGGNIAWHNEPLLADIEKLVKSPVLLENDAKLAGLSEAKLLKGDFGKVLYITISTGIGTSLIINGVIDPALDDMEGGQILLAYKGKLQKWESFASGKAIKKKYGKIAAEINDKAAWREIVETFSIGIIDLVAVTQPDIIIIGGGVGSHFAKYGDLLAHTLKKYETPLVTIPPVRGAKHPEEAVIYGCFELIKDTYAHVAR